MPGTTAQLSFPSVGALLCMLLHSVHWPVIFKLFLHKIVTTLETFILLSHLLKGGQQTATALGSSCCCTWHNHVYLGCVEAWPVTEGSESQSVRYENVFSVLYDDVIAFTTQEKSDKAELWQIPSTPQILDWKWQHSASRSQHDWLPLALRNCLQPSLENPRC